jgi:hypothetical protein
MANYAQQADKIYNDAKIGFRHGIDEQQYVRDVKLLCNRINELERVVAPFAKVGTLSNYGDSMVSVTHDNCVAAARVMDRQNSFGAGPKALEPEYLPAES